MSKPRYRLLRLLLPLIVLLVNCNTGQPSPAVERITLLGSTTALTPGSPASFLVLVRDPYSAETRGEPAGQRPTRRGGRRNPRRSSPARPTRRAWSR